MPLLVVNLVKLHLIFPNFNKEIMHMIFKLHLATVWHQRPNSLLYLLKETFTFAVSSNMQTSLFISIVKVRETRLSGLVSHILIGLSLLMLPMPLQYIPPAVLDGLFLFVAITSLSGNQMFERALLLVTEQVTLGWRRGSHCPHYQHYFHEDTNSKMELQNQNP